MGVGFDRLIRFVSLAIVSSFKIRFALRGEAN